MEKRELIMKAFGDQLKAFEFPKSGILDFTVAAMESLPGYFLEPLPDGGDNAIVTHTKAAFAFAQSLMCLECYNGQFTVTERDSIRSALLLHDGMLYGDGRERKAVHEHPELLAQALKNDYWDKFIPSFIRDDIAAAVQTHSGQWNKDREGNEDLRKPQMPIEVFVHTCVYLASRKETTFLLPGTDAYYRKAFAGQDASWKMASSVARQMTAGAQWDGRLYEEGGKTFAYLNGQKALVADELKDAFLAISSEMQPVYPCPEFERMHPGWNHMFYGTPGNLYIIDAENGTPYPVPDKQAFMYGVLFN